MIRTAMVLTAALVLAGPAQAQVRFGWRAGMILVYQYEHATEVNEKVGDSEANSATKLSGVKRWQVQNVSADGVATLEMTMTALRYEVKTSSGDTLVFDSANPDKSSPDLREQLGKYLNTPLVVLKIDAQGKVVEVQKSQYGSATGFEAQPPFLITLPAMGLQTDQAWQRDYQLTLEPPHGTGEKVPAIQQYRCKSADGSKAVITLTTRLPKPPANVAEQVPLLQWMPEGEIIFDLRHGWMTSGKLHVNQELKGHQGEDSTYRFQSSYQESMVP